MPLYVSNQQDEIAVGRELERWLARAGERALEALGLPAEAQVGVALVDDGRIKEMNRSYRGIDEATDVLAFALEERGREDPWPEGRAEGLYLGDVAVSLSTARRQADEQGRPLEEEAAWLLVHGILHLAGYDHDREQGALLMRAKEREVLSGLGSARRRGRRSGSAGRRGEEARAFLAAQGIEAAPLLEAAWEARRYAYAPYSGYSVGAAVLGRTGAVYRGCNLENASYGLSLCAERSALAQAVLAGEVGVAAVAVVAVGREAPVPCGACRQALAEFGPRQAVIVQNDREGEPVVYSLEELLPLPFGRHHTTGEPV
ncbi:MAG: rRNA maturation RNase YbeY [Clostridia bacterium]|jgi:cytidine deaminase|nr:rRNA maturation RNase YbeY [Clostridia bacterium]MDH7572208.1 rRNA maturation RNase YbeY [Clostridia bacterium]